MRPITQPRNTVKATVFGLLGLLLMGPAPTQAAGSEVRVTAQFLESGWPATCLFFGGEIDEEGSVRGTFILMLSGGLYEGNMRGFIDVEDGCMVLIPDGSMWVFREPNVLVLLPYFGDYFRIDLDTEDAEAVGYRTGRAHVTIRD